MATSPTVDELWAMLCANASPARKAANAAFDRWQELERAFAGTYRHTSVPFTPAEFDRWEAERYRRELEVRAAKDEYERLWAIAAGK